MEFLQTLDQAFFRLINIWMANPFFDVFFPAITDLHKTNFFKLIFVPSILVAWLILYRLRGLIIFLFLLVTLGMADWTGSVLKHFLMRPRPFNTLVDTLQRSDAGGYSFPSNHAVNMFCAAFFLATCFPRFRIPLFIVATLVAFSRIYNGVHYPSDVLAGSIIGSLLGLCGSWLALNVHRSIQVLLKRKKKQKNG